MSAQCESFEEDYGEVARRCIRVFGHEGSHVAFCGEQELIVWCGRETTIVDRKRTTEPLPTRRRNLNAQPWGQVFLDGRVKWHDAVARSQARDDKPQDSG